MKVVKMDEKPSVQSFACSFLYTLIYVFVI